MSNKYRYIIILCIFCAYGINASLSMAQEMPIRLFFRSKIITKSPSLDDLQNTTNLFKTEKEQLNSQGTKGISNNITNTELTKNKSELVPSAPLTLYNGPNGLVLGTKYGTYTGGKITLEDIKNGRLSANQIPSAPIPSLPLSAPAGQLVSLTMLNEAGFYFQSAKTLGLSGADTVFLDINFAKTPVVRAPWGKAMILVEGKQSLEWERRVINKGIDIVYVSATWDPLSFFSEIAKSYPDKIVRWTSDRPLILNKNNIVFSLESEIIFKIDQKYFLFNTADSTKTGVSPILKMYLASQGMYLQEWKISGGGYSINKLVGDSVNLPTKITYLSSSVIKNIFQEANTTATGSNDVRSGLAQLLDEKILVKESFTLHWQLGNGRKITIQVPALISQKTQTKFVLLDTAYADSALLKMIENTSAKCYIVQ